MDSIFLCKAKSTGPCVPTITGSESSFAINSGSTTYVNYNGTDFEADVSVDFSTGLAKTSTGKWAVELGGQSGGVETVTTNITEELYRSYRWSSDYIAYHGTQLQSGMYRITLHFLEPVFSTSGARVFDVYAQGKLVKQKLDVFIEAKNKNSPYIFETNVTVSSGILSIELWGGTTDTWVTASSEKAGPVISGISAISLFDVPKHKHQHKATMIGGIVGGIIAAIMLSLIGLWLWWRHIVPKIPTSANLGPLSKVGPVVYSYRELHEATNGFSQKQKLGEGGYGEVYRGVLRDGSIVAIKRLSETTKSNMQDFEKEVTILCMLQHKNLVSIRGYCLTSKAQLLVCDYMPNGSLTEQLFVKERDGPILSWEMRKNVAIGAACGLAYLHEESKVCVIHCDIKPGNILLDADYNSRICDFGLATFHQGNKSHVTATNTRGTAGYLAPEYAMHFRLSDKVDVYSFGVVLLELLTGRRPMQLELPSEEIILTTWVQDVFHNDISNLHKIMDKRLRNEYSEQEATDMAKIAIMCTQASPTLRPKMKDVYLMLKGSIPLPHLPQELE